MYTSRFLLFMLIAGGCISCCTNEHAIKLPQGSYSNNGSVITFDNERDITIQISNLPKEVYYYPYEYDLRKKRFDGKACIQIDLHNRISSKQAWYAEEFFLFYFPEDNTILLKKTGFAYRNLPTDATIVFRPMR